MHHIYTVKQVNSYIKNIFTSDFMLKRIYIKGEVSNCKYHSSGHIYFSLKDESGTISCVLFAGRRSGLSFRMQDGQQVVVLGTVSVYERDGKYQLYADEIILEGAGLLYEKFEKLKKELEEMGMFAPEYKQPIPAYAKTIGVVTAPTGAAVRDIIQVSTRRNPYVQIILYPAKVQGEGSAESVCEGIKALEEKQVDVIIVGRGGGSIEDLWAFNEEIVARAIFNCTVPIISAVGHETDTTIADYVADMRAPTPSAAAELAVYKLSDLEDALYRYKISLNRAISVQIDKQRNKAAFINARLKGLDPKMKAVDARQRALYAEERITLLFNKKLNESKHKLHIYIERMKGLSPLEKLSKGYSYIVDEDGNNINSVSKVNKGDNVRIYLTDGIADAHIDNVTEVDLGGRK